VTEIVEKPDPDNVPSDLMNLVFHYFSSPSDFFPYLKNATQGDDRYEKALNAFMHDKQVELLRYDGYWMKIKYPYHVLDMMECFLKNRIKKHRSPSSYVSPQAHIEGEVYIDDHAHVDSFAVIKGPAYIGKYAKVGNHALVRQSVVEESAVIGFGSEVARSYVGPSCMLHHNFIGDSVLERNVNPSWGTTTANLRLDGKTVMLKLPEGNKIDSGKKKLGAIIAKDAFLGVNCSIMPGYVVDVISTAFGNIVGERHFKNFLVIAAFIF
jgi:bifunctional UDP-N-acetylglucosamine pyrophosphorylase/glucosamine-1-phosphate N-acetyltransferase